MGKWAGGFRWHDRNRATKWNNFACMRWLDFMLCQILESLEQNRPEFARAQVVQCMKCLHEFSRQGSWRAAWPLTHKVDPFDIDGHGGDSVEMDVIMSWLRTKDDFRSKVADGAAKMSELVSDDSEGAGEDGAAAESAAAAARKSTGAKKKAAAKAKKAAAAASG